MSYLDLPRLHFGGQFRATPSTFNNVHDNYDPANWPSRSGPNIPSKDVQLYWNPQGNGIIDFVDCVVTSAIGEDTQPHSETIVGQPVIAASTKGPPQLVDLDTDQQGVSEIWGLLMQIGDPSGAFVRGVFQPAAFNSLWQNSQGPNTPNSSAAYSTVYQSTLTDLAWGNPSGAGHSEMLAKLQEIAEKNVSEQYPEPRLSVKMVIDSHNNAPEQFLFNAKTFQEMNGRGVPTDVTAKLQPIATLSVSGKNLGLIPTSSYVNYLLTTLLGEQVAKQYAETVLSVTRQPYTSKMPTRFGNGRLIGSIGAASADQPRYAVPARTLAPTTNSPAYFAPAKLRADGLTVDLGNSLPVKFPGDEPWAEKLGPVLTLKCGAAFSKPINYGGDLLSLHAGLIDIPLDPASAQYKAIANNPLSIVGTPGGKETTLLEENPGGFTVRADQFVFRMNPGEPTGPDNLRGSTAEVTLHARAFGRTAGAVGKNITVAVSGQQSVRRTSAKLVSLKHHNEVSAADTSGEASVVNLDPVSLKVGENGTATFKITANDPGNPRGYIDGQVYFINYTVQGVNGFVPDPSSFVSIHVYQDTKIADPTWENGVAAILSQYGQLYPVMGKFGLRDHDSVKNNAGMIRRVLELEYEQPLHMPATRDLSESKRRIILRWMDKGMP